MNTSAKTAPIARLPPEILSVIFTTAADSDRAAITQAGPSIDKPTVFANVLSSVYSYWRGVALDTPALWARISLNRKGGLVHAALWLGRAGSYPLQISSDPAGRQGADEEWIALLEPHSHKFNSLRLHIDFLGLKIFRNACVRRATAPIELKFLALSCFSRDRISIWETNRPQDEEIGRMLQSTHSIHLHNISLGSWSSLAFQGLRHLCLDNLSHGPAPSYKQLLDVLRANPDLRYFQLSRSWIFYASFFYDRDAPPVHLKRLETLRLECLQTITVRWLLEYLVLPPEGVTLILSEYDGHAYETRIGVGLHVLSSHSISTLCFGVALGSSRILDIVALLADFPRLDTLVLEYVEFHVAEHTAYSEDRYAVLPNVALVSCKMNDPGSLMDMLVRHSVRRMRVFDCGGALDRKFVLDSAPNVQYSEDPESFLTLTWPLV